MNWLLALKMFLIVIGSAYIICAMDDAFKGYRILALWFGAIVLGVGIGIVI